MLLGSNLGGDSFSWREGRGSLIKIDRTEEPKDRTGIYPRPCIGRKHCPDNYRHIELVAEAERAVKNK